MKIKKLFYLLFIVCAIPSILISYVYAQTPGTSGGTVIAPPSGGSETITIPQTENMEVLPVPLPNAGTTQTTTVMQPQQPSENITPLIGSTPTISEQPLMPIPEGAVPAMPSANISEGTQTSTTIQPLPSLEQQPETEQLPGAQQPSAQLPVLPVSPTTAETMTPAAEVSPQPQSPQIQPLPSPLPSVTEGVPAVTSLPEQNIPAPAAHEEEAVRKPPHIVPGEVLSGMPAYVNVRTTHIVKPGEDLHWIAAVYYGDARLWKRIYDANKNVIKNPNHLVVGTKLVIPPK